MARAKTPYVNKMHNAIFPNIKLLIVEDSVSFRSLLKLLLDELNIQQPIFADNARDALALFEQEQPHVCILDIDLGEGKPNGIELAEQIREADQEVPIIFLTSFFTEEFYFKARHVNPTNFMSKEISRFKLIQALDIAINQHIEFREKNEARPQPPAVPPLITDDKAYFRVGDSFKGIDLCDISYFYSKDKLTYARVGRRNFPTNVQLKMIEQELYPLFLRTHKTYAVNRKHIKSLNIKEGNLIIEKGDETLPIGYAYRKHLLAELKILK